MCVYYIYIYMYYIYMYVCVLYTRFSEKWSPRGPPKFRLGAPGQTCPPQDHTAPSARRFDETVPPPWSPTKLLEV